MMFSLVRYKSCFFKQIYPALVMSIYIMKTILNLIFKIFYGYTIKKSFQQTQLIINFISIGRVCQLKI